MCFAPQQRAFFRHLNFQKWSGAGVFCTFWLRNVLCATTACNFSSLIWPPAALASLLFDPPEPQIIGKTQCFATFLPFSRTCIFFLLTLSLLWSSLFYSSLLSDSSHLCFSSVHMVGSLTSKLPSIIIDFLVRIETIRNRNAYRSMFMGNCLVPYLMMVTLAGSGAMVFPGSNHVFLQTRNGLVLTKRGTY